MKLQQTIFVAGHRGMVGAAIVRRMQALGYANIVTATLEEGLRDAYEWFVANRGSARLA